MSANTAAKSLIAAARNNDPWGAGARELNEEQKVLAAKLNQEARENWSNPAWHQQVAADIADALDYGFTFENSFGQYIRQVNLGFTDRYVIKERRGIKVFWTSRGGYIDESQLVSERWEVPRDTLGFHVSEHEDKLQINFSETIQEMVNLGNQRMDAEVNRRILSLATAAVPAGSDSYVTTAGLTKDVLDQAIREVRDQIRPTGGNPVPVTVIARPVMMDAISDFPGYAFEALEEIRLRGRLGTYRGANLQELRHFTDEEGLDFAPANEVWVLGGEAGVFINYGGVKVKAWTENTVDYQHWRARKDVGGLIHKPNMVRRIIDTTVAP